MGVEFPALMTSELSEVFKSTAASPKGAIELTGGGFSVYLPQQIALNFIDFLCTK